MNVLKNPVVTIVSLDEHVLKIVQGSRRDKPRLDALVSKKITGLSDTDLAAAFTQTLSSLPHKTREVEFLLPRHTVILRMVELPSVDEREIRELAGFQAVKQTPYTLDEIVLDTQVLKKETTGASKVLLVVAQKDIIERMLNIAQMARVTVKAVRLGSQGAEAAFLDVSDGGVFVSVDYARSLFLAFSEGKARYSRSLPIGLKDRANGPESDAAFQQKLARELGLSVKACQKENPGLALHKLWMEPEAKEWNIVREFAVHEGLGEPSALDPMQGLATGEKTRMLLDKDLSFARSDIAGAFAHPVSMTLNLLPGDYARTSTQAHRRRNIGQIALLSGVLAVVCLLLVVERAADKMLYKGKLEKNIRQIQAKVAEAEARSEKLEIARNVERNQGQVLRVLRELYERIPEGVSLASLSYERDKALIIKGTAKDLSDVFQFIPVLEKSPYFESVASQYASKRRVLDKEYTDFQIQCMLSS